MNDPVAVGKIVLQSSCPHNFLENNLARDFVKESYCKLEIWYF